jgi:hypothetical protein
VLLQRGGRRCRAIPDRNLAGNAEFEARMASMVTGVGLAVLAVWLRSPSLALFIPGGVLVGAGSAAIFKGRAERS